MNTCRAALSATLLTLALCLSGPAQAQMPDAARQADIVFLGEVHDNPAHHATQARWVAEVQPRALVFEMILPDTASALTPDLLQDRDALEHVLDWSKAGWPDFGLYYPIFQAAPGPVYGAAIPRSIARSVVRDGPGAALPTKDIKRFGLDTPLPDKQLARRKVLQMAAHCDALPESVLPGMVTVQRVRDASLASAALRALQDTGGPVVVITGNGHARSDWGAPAAVARAAPDTRVFALGQAEAGHPPDGTFDMILAAPAVPRDDPCAAFE